MVEVWLAVWSGLNVASIALIWWRLEKNAILMRHEIESSARTLAKAAGDPSEIVDSLADELQSVIGEAMGNFRTPQLADHLGAILSQWAQIKMAKEMQNFTPATPEIEEAV
jgi:hypothetical protein